MHSNKGASGSTEKNTAYEKLVKCALHHWKVSTKHWISFEFIVNNSA